MNDRDEENGYNYGINTANIVGDREGLFPASDLVKKMGDNMAKSEAVIDDKPLWTEKTAELERKND